MCSGVAFFLAGWATGISKKTARLCPGLRGTGVHDSDSEM